VRFWDSSAIVPLVVRQQAQSGAMNRVLEDDHEVVTWWGTLVECLSAVARLRRVGSLDTDQEQRALNLFHTLASGWAEIEPIHEVRQAASRLVPQPPLRAADAFQLGAAQVWTDLRPRGHVFVSLDNRLRAAASNEGFTVLPE
jgi:uncharacterized protein